MKLFASLLACLTLLACSQNPSVLEVDSSANAVKAQAFNPCDIQVCTWRQLGSSILPPSSPYQVNAVVLRIGSNGLPTVAVSDSALSFTNLEYRVTVKRWDGTAWQSLGGTRTFLLSRSVLPSQVDMVLDAGNNPVVAFRANGFSSPGPYALSPVVVQRWNGSAWQNFGGAIPLSDLTSESLRPYHSLTLDLSGNPVVAWSQTAGVRVSRWLSASNIWSTTSGGPFNAINPRIAVDQNDAFLLSYLEPIGGYTGTTTNLRVARRVNNTWQSLGTPNQVPLPRPQADTDFYDMKLDPSRNPVVVFGEPNPNNPNPWLVKVKKYASSTGFSDLGPAFQLAYTYGNQASLAISSSGQVVVSYVMSYLTRILYAHGFNSSSNTWPIIADGNLTVSPPVANHSSAYFPSISIAPNGNPMAAFLDVPLLSTNLGSGSVILKRPAP